MKILIIRFSSIGDIVLTTPVVRCLKQQLPDVELHYLTKPAFEKLLEPNPYIDKIHTLQDSLSDTAKQLKQERFDWVIDLHNNQRTLLLKTMLGRPSRSFNKLNVEKWLMVQLKWNCLPNEHIVNRYLETIAHLGIKNDEAGLDHFLPQEVIDNPPDVPGTFEQAYVAIAIGAQHATKKLPTEKLIELCQKLDKPIMLLGGPTDEATGATISKAAGNHVWNACGKMSLQESALMVKNATVIITHDTGLMHIAAAFQKPILSIWGNTIPEFGMYPYYSNEQQDLGDIYEIKGLACRPCSKIGHQQCPKGHFKCMMDQDIVAIALRASALLA